MSVNLSRLLASPPAMRSEIFRHVLLNSNKTKVSVSTQRSIHVLGGAHGYSRPRIRFIIDARRRFQSTTTQSTTTSSADQQSDKPPKSRTRRFLTSAALVLVFFTTGLAMAAAPAAETVNGYVNPATDAETLLLYQPSTASEAETNDYVINHPLSVRLRSQSDMYESRPHMRIPPAMRAHNLTAGTLMGEGKIEVPPLNFNDKDAELPSMTQIMYLGPSLCGHPGVVHGGLLSTLLDEGLARACFPALPNKVGVTASLKIDYRVPCPAGRYVVLKAHTTKVDGRKVWAKGWIELLGDDDSEGVKLVEAEALYIEPKHAKNGMVKNIVANN